MTDTPVVTPAPMPTLTPQQANAALQFLGRVTMQPPEIQAFQEVTGALQRIVEAAQPPG